MAIQFDSARLGQPGDGTPRVWPWVLGDDGQLHLERRPAPGEPAPDYFAVLGLPRRLLLDPQHVEITFRSLVRALHPDRHHVHGARAAADAQWHTSLVNDAWRTLRDFDRRVRYVLELGGDVEAAAERFRPPAALLAQVLDYNEAVDTLQEAMAAGDAQAAQAARRDLSSARAELQALRDEVGERLLAAARQWDAAVDQGSAEGQQEARRALRAALGHTSYLDNLLARVDTVLAPEA